MAAKNWLIRTTQNQILGPVSKEKIIELIKSGKLEDDDEVASGNGYWFYIKEEDLVEKYLLGDVPQGFNPVYEVEPVLTRRIKKDKTSTMGNAKAALELRAGGKTDDGFVLPSNDDLEYPDIEINIDDIEDDNGDDDITVVGQINIEAGVAEQPAEAPASSPSNPAAASNVGLMSRAPDRLDEERSRPGVLPDEDDLEYPDLGINQEVIDQQFEQAGDEGEDASEMEESEDMTMVGAAPIVAGSPESPTVEIFDEVDPAEEESPKAKAPTKKTKTSKKAVSKNAAGASKSKAKKKTGENSARKRIKSREFADREDVTRDDIIEAELKKSAKKRSGRGRRRGIDTYLILFFGSILIIIAAVIFYYKKVIKKPIPFLSSISIIETANAQIDLKPKKKI